MTPAIDSEMMITNSGSAAKRTCSAIVPPVKKPQVLLSMAAPSSEYNTRIPSRGVQKVRTSRS